jgi:plastocyanin
MAQKQLWLFISAIGLISVGANLEGVTAARADGDEAKAICAKAEERFEELYADMPIDEGTVVIKMYKYTFCPVDLEVPVGTKLRWINVDKRTSHSVWFKESGQEESERLFPDEFVEKTMETPGRFNYVCGPHGEQEGMRGSMTVTP